MHTLYPRCSLRFQKKEKIVFFLDTSEEETMLLLLVRGHSYQTTLGIPHYHLVLFL
jgi:hypothetical protein